MSNERAVHEFDRALCRSPARSVTGGLRALDRGDPTYDGVLAEHDAYVAALREAGVVVDVLDPLEAFPDSMFVEDPALVFTQGAVLLRPGAESRSGEAATLAPALRERFDRVLTLPQGTADGGDVLTTADSVMIGLSARTDRTGAAALSDCLADLGLKATIVETPAGVLHFKSDCAMLDDTTVLVTRRLAASGVFGRFRTLIVPDGEEAAANSLRVNGVVLAGREHRRTIAMLRESGFTVLPLAVGEIGRIDAGLSCMSLRWLSRSAGQTSVARS